MKSGIYKILNTINGKFYIGSAVSLALRIGRHKRDLNKNQHQNRILQRAWNKYSDIVFEFQIIEVIENPTKETLLSREQYYLDTLKPIYNLSPTAGNSLGVKHTTETKANMSKAKRQMTAETKALFSKIRTGKKHSEEHKRNISKGRKGKLHSQETKDKIRAIHLGRKDTPEQIKRKSERKRDKTKWPHEEGIKCRCDECREKLNAYKREWDKIRKIKT